jgi:hypothetical protein
MAWYGTELASNALQIAWVGTAAAESGIGLANSVLPTAWAGTSGAASAIGLANEALTRSFAGTSAIDLANQALTLAWLGTVSSSELAETALETAWAGTSLAYTALVTTWAGTAAAAASIDLANQVYQVATSGTAAAAAGIGLANQALLVGYTGTALAAAGSNLAYNAHVDVGTKLDLAGGTLTGNLVVPNIEVGIGTVPYSTAVSGTIYYDFNGPAYQMTTVREGVVFVSAVNMNAGREIAVLLQQSGTSQALEYSSSFTWYGTIPPATVSNKNVLIAMTSLGDDLSNVIAGVSVAR